MSDCLDNLKIYNLGPVNGDDDSILLYAPLSCNSVIVSAADLQGLRSAAKGEILTGEYAEALDLLAYNEPVPRIRHVEDFVNLSILPTNSCNFACSYCYSAKGRSSATIDFAAVERMIRFFVGLPRENMPSLHITLFGGGEPMLCWSDLVRPAIEQIEKMRDDCAAKIHITIITNGSILPADFAKVCKRSNVDLAISFEILEELQNLQRHNYRRVYDNILNLCRSGIVPAINSVITDEAVRLMPRMVFEAIEKIPGVKYLSFEPMSGEHTRRFYDRFIECFFEAKAIADSYGVILTTSALRNVDVTVERYCAGELVLNATGEITACPCLSSPQQPGYHRWVYGQVSAGEVRINFDKLASLLDYDVNDQPWCKHCFARYNCGGGCLNNTIERGHKPDSEYCRFFKEFLRKIIIQRTL